MSDTDDVMHVEEPEDSLPEISFEEIPEALKEACGRMGWTKLMPVQAKSLPYLLAGRDLMVQSRTGSGKTGAFVLPILEKIDPAEPGCQALVLAPTRELARQVAREAEILAGPDGPKVVAVYGGVAYGQQTQAMKDGAQIVVGTPGRVLDHLLKRNFTLDRLKVLVFDEADRMLSIGFYPDMKAVQRYLPRRPVGMLMFSATFPPLVLRLAKEFMREPQMLSLSSRSVHVAEVTHASYEVPRMQKDRALMRIIEVLNPSSCFVFCNTKHQVHYLSQVLQNFGYNADELSADLTQGKREQILERLRRGEVKFLVATDVAARGIDIPDLSHVVLYEPPEDPESYIHRAGRTGRAGAVGEVVSLTDTMESVQLERISRLYKIDIEKRSVPTDEDVAAVVSERTTAILEARLRTLKPLAQERMQRAMPLARALAESEDALPLVAMLLDEIYQASLHAPAPLPEGERPAPREARREGGRDGGRDGGREGGRGRERGRERDREPRQGGERQGDDRRVEPRPAQEAPAQAAPAPASGEQPSLAEGEGDGEAKRRKRRRRRRKKKPGGGEQAAMNGQAQGGQPEAEAGTPPAQAEAAHAPAAPEQPDEAAPASKKPSRSRGRTKKDQPAEAVQPATDEAAPAVPGGDAEAKPAARKPRSRKPAAKAAGGDVPGEESGAKPAAAKAASAKAAPKTAAKEAPKEAARKSSRGVSRKAAAGPVPTGRNPWESKSFGGSLDDAEDDDEA